jgi:hypothetical protein
MFLILANWYHPGTKLLGLSRHSLHFIQSHSSNVSSTDTSMASSKLGGEITGESKSGMDEPSEMVPKTSSDSGSGSSGLFVHQDGSEASWSGLLLTSASAIETARATTNSSEGGENSESHMD